MADPSTNPIRLPGLVEFGRTLQTLAAALVIAFDPITPGSGLCTGGLHNCSWLPPALDYPGIVKSIGDLWPGNPVINEWLDARANGIANVPTEEQIETAQRLANQNGSFWGFGNPPVPSELINGSNPSTLAPYFHQLWTNLGLDPPPLAPSRHSPHSPQWTGSGGRERPHRRSRDPVEGQVIEKDPRTIESALRSVAKATCFGRRTHPTDRREPTPAAPDGSETPKPGTTSPTGTGTDPTETDPTGTGPTGTGSTGSLSGTASQTGNSGSLGNVRKRFLPHKPGTTNTGTTTTDKGPAPSSDAPSKAARHGRSGG